MVKKVVTLVVIAFAAFYLFTEPKASADVVRNAVGVVGNGFQSIVSFLTALFR